MDKLIYREVRVITSLATKHPRVLNIWETGSAADVKEGPMYYNIHIILKDDSGITFKGEWPDKVLEEAEEYLQSLPKDR